MQLSLAHLVARLRFINQSPRSIRGRRRDGRRRGAPPSGSVQTVALQFGSTYGGLSKARFVVGDGCRKELVPGSIARHCDCFVRRRYGATYIRGHLSEGDKISRADGEAVLLLQRCQAAAAMRRYRSNRKRTAEPKLKRPQEAEQQVRFEP